VSGYFVPEAIEESLLAWASRPSPYVFARLRLTPLTRRQRLAWRARVLRSNVAAAWGHLRGQGCE
jgi:hypothetical protein